MLGVAVAGVGGDGGALHQGEPHIDQSADQPLVDVGSEELAVQADHRVLEQGRHGVHHDPELGVGAGGHRDLEDGRVGGAPDDLPQNLHSLVEGSLVTGVGAEDLPEMGGLLIEEVLDGGGHQLRLGREMMRLGAAGHSGPFGHHPGCGTRVAHLDQAVDRCFQQGFSGLGCPFRLGAAKGGVHGGWVCYKPIGLFVNPRWAAVG